MSVPRGRTGDWAAVIVNYNAGVFLDGCLRALYDGALPPAEVVVVDNASTDDSLQELAGWPQVVVAASRVNLGFAGGANLGVSASESPLVVVLNPDVVLDPGFGPALVSTFASDPALGAAGAKLRYPDGDILQHAGGVVEYPLLTTHHRGYGERDEGQWDQPAEVDFVTGGAMALRREAFDAVGGFDEEFYPAYYEDVDLCFRLRAAGWRVSYQPALSGTHYESVTLGRSLPYFRSFHRSRLRFALKHLDRETWWTQFVPAEVERLRGELNAVEDPDWPARSGAEAIELLVRTGARLPHGLPPILSGEPLSAAVASLSEVRERASLAAEPRAGRRGRLRDWLSRLSARAAVRDLYWQQRAFNESVVRALEAQDRLNRELVADLLAAMLDLAVRPGAEPSTTNEPTIETPPPLYEPFGPVSAIRRLDDDQ